MCTSSESIELSSSPSAVEELVSSLLLSLDWLLNSPNSLFKQSTYLSAFSNSPSALPSFPLIISSSFSNPGTFSLNGDLLGEEGAEESTLSEYSCL
jgi:hypothetical protein